MKLWVVISIDHDILVAFNKKLTDIDQFILTDELNFMIKVKGENELILSNPKPFSFSNFLPFTYEYTKALTFQPGTKRIGQLDLPGSKASENSEKYLYELTLQPDSNNILVRRSTIFTGNTKRSGQNRYVNTESILLANSNQKYYPQLQHFSKKKGVKRLKEKLALKSDKREEEIARNMKLRVEDQFERNSSSLFWKVEHSGNNHEKPEFKLLETFKLSDYALQSNNNLLVQIGKYVKHEELFKKINLKDRKHDFFFDYPESATYQIHLKIPESYELDDIEHLNQSIESSVGLFKSEATISNNELLITIDFKIDAYQVPSTKWEAVEALLNAPFNFSNEVILLRSLKK